MGTIKQCLRRSSLSMNCHRKNEPPLPSPLLHKRVEEREMGRGLGRGAAGSWVQCAKGLGEISLRLSRRYAGLGAHGVRAPGDWTFFWPTRGQSQRNDMPAQVATGGRSAAPPCRMGLAALAPPEKPVCHGESFMRGYRGQWIAGVTQTERITGEENTEPNYHATG